MDTLIAGASGGIGLAMARQALEQHPQRRVLALARNIHSSDALKTLAESFPERLIPIAGDVTDAGNLSHSLKRSLPGDIQLGRVVYAIGVLHNERLSPEKRLEQIDPAALLESYQVNTVGFLTLMQALLPWLRHREPKTIAAISAKVGSIGDNGFGGWYSYRCSKAALNMAVRNLSIEAARRLKPAIVVALHPGTTETRLTAPFQQSLSQLKVHTPAETAANLWAVIDGLTEEDSGQFLSWDGSHLPW